MYLVISTSLDPDSRSRILARTALSVLENRSVDPKFVDLSELEIPQCDGTSCYEHPDSVALTKTVANSQGILIASPIYNYDVSSAAKNMIEITGKSWTNKVVGFMCAAGGQGSFMAPMGVANSLMLDFRSLILPRFIFATGDEFMGDKISNTDCEQRIEELADQLIRVTQALAADPRVQS